MICRAKFGVRSLMGLGRLRSHMKLPLLEILLLNTY